jgi:hypothetical protein
MGFLCCHNLLKTENWPKTILKFYPSGGEVYVYVGSDSLQSLVLARRLILLTRQLEKHRLDPTAETKSFKEIMEEDEIQLSGGVQSSYVQPEKAPTTSDANVDIKLSDLTRQLDELRKQSPSTANSTDSVTFTQTSSTSLEVEWKSYEQVDGLVVRDKHLAETNLYTFEFLDGTSFKITDKSTGKSTTIWGDPHIDTSDQDGSSNGEFSDLKSSDSYTTFSLRDGTRITFTAKDNGLIEAVDIVNNNQQVHGTGSGDSTFSEETGLFDTRLKTSGSLYSLPSIGDIVYAGGDGNDWFDASQRLVWGKTTGPLATSVPKSYMQIRYTEQVQQTLTVNHSA